MSSLAFHLCAVARCGEHFERAAAIGLAGSARPHDHMCKIISTIQVTMSAIISREKSCGSRLRGVKRAHRANERVLRYLIPSCLMSFKSTRRHPGEKIPKSKEILVSRTPEKITPVMIKFVRTRRTRLS